MKTVIIISIILTTIGLYFSVYAYAVDNNCGISVWSILQLTPILGCIEDRLDALENATISSSNGTSVSIPHIAQLQFSMNGISAKINIGTVYVDIYTSGLDFEELDRLHGANVTYYRINYDIDYAGTGNQTYRWVDSGNNTNVLFEGDIITADCPECISTWFVKPSWIGDNEVKIKMQGKSTTGTDDPVIRGYQIHAK